MPSIKQNQLGGMGLPGSLLSQRPEKFRDMLNMVQDPDGVYYTRNGDEAYDLTAQTGTYQVRKVVPYVGETGESPVLMCSATSGVSFAPTATEMFLWDLENNVRAGRQSSTRITLTDSEIAFTELDDVLYFIPQKSKEDQLAEGGGLQKWDGFKWHRAGLPRCAVINNTVSGATYSRSVYLTLDFKGNETISDYTQRQNTPAAGNITMNPTLAGGALALPLGSQVELLDKGFDNKYLARNGAAASTYSAGPKEFLVTATSHNLVVGDWLMFYPGSGSVWVTNQGLAKVAGYNVPYLLSMRVKSISGLDVTFDATEGNSYIWVDKSEWITATELDLRGANVSGSWSTWATVLTALNTAERLNRSWAICSNTWILHFTSTSALSGYGLRYVRPVAYSSPTYLDTVPTASLDTFLIENPFNSFTFDTVTPTPLEDVFDDTVTRIPFPVDVKYLTTSTGFLIACSETVAYYSSPSFGASPEMADGLTNFVPGTNRDGLIVGVGATENFVFISREKRNYSVVGNIATGNFEVRAYRETQPGVTDYKNIISIQDNVLFANKFGIFAANQASQVPLSGGIVGMFYKATTQRQSIDGAPLGPIELAESSYDFTRNWVSWRYVLDGSDYLLVLDLNNGEYYRWSWLTGTCQFINGLYYIAQPGVNASLKIEEVSGVDVDGEEIESWLTTSWIHLEEPSLEKQFTQVKLFMRKPDCPGNITLSAYQDWQPTIALQGNVPFEIDPAYPLSQKHKFASNKSLAISLTFKAVPGERMEIEGYELEYNPIQEGMKR